MLSSVRPRVGQSVCRACQQTQQRSAHKFVEVELQRDVERLGKAGDRLIVTPGLARNSLIPRGLALYLTRNGQSCSPMRDLLHRTEGWVAARRKEAELAAVAEHKALQAQDEARKHAETQEQLRLAQEKFKQSAEYREQRLQASLEALPVITVYRRVKDERGLYGSVTSSDIVEAIRAADIALDGGLGAFEEGPGVEQGRVKEVGTYTFAVPLKTLKTSAAVTVQVLPEEKL